MVLMVDQKEFNKFLKDNKEKIGSMVPSNPSISKEDEWYKEADEDND